MPVIRCQRGPLDITTLDSVLAERSSPSSRRNISEAMYYCQGVAAGVKKLSIPIHIPFNIPSVSVLLLNCSPVVVSMPSTKFVKLFRLSRIRTKIADELIAVVSLPHWINLVFATNDLAHFGPGFWAEFGR